jgi:hypothetical protein
MTKQALSQAQERNLNRLFLCGDFGEHRWPSIRSLADMGYIELGRKISLTEKGRAYCIALNERTFISCAE